MGLVVIVVSTVLAGLAARRAARVEGGSGTGTGFGRTSAVLVSLLIVVYVVAIWAMSTKPT
jgi:hypothetical protein